MNDFMSWRICLSKNDNRERMVMKALTGPEILMVRTSLIGSESMIAVESLKGPELLTRVQANE